MPDVESSTFAGVYNDKVKNALRANTKNAKKMQLPPYCDVQTLSEDPMNLIAILHYRSNTDPANWVLFDSEQ
ncbi:hypothetical protein LTS01_026053, partial [Friedmanniomyces endolithicus]